MDRHALVRALGSNTRWYAGVDKTTGKPMLNGTRLAAVDLGSNSFRLEIVRLDHGHFERTEYLKEPIRQGAGMDADRNLSVAAMQRGWECLARFGERLSGFERSQVRAVATQTLREARNRDVFLQRASQVLGFPIDVISGREEARLIYQGVSNMLPRSTERRLVVDIGGRSTELIVGKGNKPTRMESYRVGSIAWSTRYFAGGQFTKHAFQAAEIAAKAVLDEAIDDYGASKWDVAYGSAGTVGAVGDILVAAGAPAGLVTQQGLDWLQARLLEAHSAERLQLPGMKEDRRHIIAGGVAILRAIFDLLGIEQMLTAEGGLRHGLLSDMVGPAGAHDDVRTASVHRLMTKFDVDTAHAARVEQVATQLFEQLMKQAPERSREESESHARKLRWAAQLHEIGAHISHSDYHKHGAYILDNADATGFALNELHRLSLLVLGHRGKLRKLAADFEDAMLVHLLMALRLAIILCHARREPDVDGLVLAPDVARQRGFVLSSRPGWTESYPQSAHLLREEVLAWQKTSWSLALAER
jgi:exopolyphosphatase / guanosine-5'-triphosphate,3'-diphosphate pyrophosphatase